MLSKPLKQMIQLGIMAQIICGCAVNPPSESKIKEVENLDEIKNCKKIGMVNGRSPLGIMFFQTSISNAKAEALEKAYAKNATHLYFTQVNPPTMQGGAWVTGDAYNCFEREEFVTSSSESSSSVIALTHNNSNQNFQKTNDYIAILELESNGLDKSVSSTITDILINKMQASGCYRVMERSQIDKILKEQGFQNSGACSASECAVEMGRILSIQKMIIGSIGKLGNSYVINLRMIDVSSGEVLANSSRQIVGGIENAAPVSAEMISDLCKGN